jgi:hypothetical protein
LGRLVGSLFLPYESPVTTVAGFNYDFHSLGADSHSTRDELHEAFAKISASELNTGLFDILKARFPVFRRILVSITGDLPFSIH